MNIAIVVVILLIVAFAIYNIIMGNKPKKQQEAQKKELYRKLYKILSKNFITSSSIRKIYGKLSNLCVYKREELYLLEISVHYIFRNQSYFQPS